MEINDDLKDYIEKNIFPKYSKNEPAHNIDHIKYVIHRSFKFAYTLPNINYNMVYTIAAYHDIGHHIDSKTHEIISADMMFKDDRLKTDPVLVELRKQYNEIGEQMPGWNWDEYTDLDDYKERMQERLKLLKKEKNTV